MTTSILYVDNTGPANQNVQGVGSTDADNTKSMININEAGPISEDTRYSNCMHDICEEQLNVTFDHDVGEDDIKDIYLTSENDHARVIPCKADDVKEINTSENTSKNEPKHFMNINGDDTDNDVEGERTENTVQRTIDPRCQANDGDGCYLASTDHRKIVSQYFGRNKRCTQLLADRLWLVWCRKHYQQRRYNLQQEGTWHLKKLELIRVQIKQFQDFTDIAGWEITLHKTEQVLLDKENAAAAVPGADPPTSPVWERFLEPYLGFNKSYEQLYAVLRVIEAEFQTTAFLGRDNKNKNMPAIEFLPLFPRRIASKPEARPKSRVFIPHIKAKDKPLTSDSASQTVTRPEHIDRTATLDTTPSLSWHYKRQAPSLSPLTNVAPEQINKRRRLMRGIRPKMAD